MFYLEQIENGSRLHKYTLGNDRYFFSHFEFLLKNRPYFDHFPSLWSLKNVKEAIFATFQNPVISRLQVVFSSRVLNKTNLKWFYSPQIHLGHDQNCLAALFSLALKSTILYQIALQQPLHNYKFAQRAISATFQSLFISRLLVVFSSRVLRITSLKWLWTS